MEIEHCVQQEKVVLPGLPDASLYFRLMKLDDLDRILELEQRCFSDPWSRQNFEVDLLGYGLPGLHLVGVYKGEIIAYSNTWFITDEAHLGNFAVAPEYRKKGVGKAMLQYIISETRNQGMSCIHLEVRISNIHAIELYEKYGFNRIGIRKKYYKDNKEDAVLMLCQLS